MAENSRNTPPDLRKLREAILRERDRQKAAARDLEKLDAPVADRLDAIRSVEPANDPGAAGQLLRVLVDDAANVELRVAAIQRMETSILQDTGLIAAVIALVRERATPAPLRAEGLKLLQVGDIASAPFRVLLADYVNLLRDLLDDPDDHLRKTATQVLALKGDPLVQDRLLRELKGDRERTVQPEEAIQFLSYNLHANHLPVLRDIVKNPPNVASKKEALRNLAADTESGDLLASVVEDQAEDPEIRHVAAVSLAATQPARVREAAQRIVLDGAETGSLRTAMLNTLAHSKGRQPRDWAFAEALARIPKRGLPPAFRAVYDRFLSGRERDK